MQIGTHYSILDFYVHYLVDLDIFVIAQSAWNRLWIFYFGNTKVQKYEVFLNQMTFMKRKTYYKANILSTSDLPKGFGSFG